MYNPMTHQRKKSFMRVCTVCTVCFCAIQEEDEPALLRPSAPRHLFITQVPTSRFLYKLTDPYVALSQCHYRL